MDAVRAHTIPADRGRINLIFSSCVFLVVDPNAHQDPHLRLVTSVVRVLCLYVCMYVCSAHSHVGGEREGRDVRVSGFSCSL